MRKKSILIILTCIFLIILISLILYNKPLFSDKPLGLDASGHLSKISYIKEFGLGVSWDLAWYNGSPFLAYYSPIFYSLSSLFGNSIFGANFLQFLSILLTSIGIFFLVYYYTGSKFSSLISALFFLSVFCTSYYFISVGNSPYVFGLFTIPWTIFFMEKSFKKINYNFILYSIFFLLAFLSHIFMALCLFLIVFIRLLIFIYFNHKDRSLHIFFRKSLIFLGTPLLISSFWFLPFLSKSSSFLGDKLGYVPSPFHLLGFGKYIIWGLAPGEIGPLFGLFILSIFFSIRFLKEEKTLFLFISSLVLFLLTEGILWKFYPTGVGAIRFILPFSIFACIFFGVVFIKLLNFKISITKKWIICFFIFLMLLFSLIYNYSIIIKNFNDFSYNSDGDRYGMIKLVYSQEDFPLINNFTNYRFGTSRYIFSETINYKSPWISQTWGYFDQGILYPDELYSCRDYIWRSNNIHYTLKCLDDFGIKYFEIGGEDLKFEDKFINNENFSLVYQKVFSDYPFKIYEYKNAKPIISIMFENGSYEDLSNFYVERNNPDKITVRYNFSGKEKISFKESFHNSWRALAIESKKEISIKKSETNFMTMVPEENSEKILIYQSKTGLEKIGILLTILGVIFSILIIYNRKLKKI